MAHLHLHLLGSPQVELNGKPIELSTRKVLALLAYLAVTAQPHSRDALATLLWPESDQAHARGSLRHALATVREVLGEEWLELQGEMVRLRQSDILTMDVMQFLNSLAACRTHGHREDEVCEACETPLSEAAALYSGDFMSGFLLSDSPAFDEWQYFQSERLRNECSGVLERLVQFCVAKSEIAAAIPFAHRLVNLDVLHEHAHRQLMQLYAVNGQKHAALHQFEICMKLLHEELDASPAPETIVLYEQIRQGEVINFGDQRRSKPVSAFIAQNNLPSPTTPFIGRAKEIDTIIPFFCDDTRRLITILGPGGIGKTRFAQEVAAKIAYRMPHSIFFVPLAHLNDSTNIISTIALTLNLQFLSDGRTPTQQLFDYLRHKQTLLMLDNFEHLLDGVALIQELLQNCPKVRLLVTSRERLQLVGETIFSLGSLDFPIGSVSRPYQEYDAIQLFLETAHRIRPNDAQLVDAINHVARICQLLGGMPLGIILAASWIEVLSPEEIAAELSQGLDLLKTELRDLPERQRSMHTVLAYSWQHLSVAEQGIFMRLALFRGGFTRAAAREIAGATLSHLARLADKSFIQRMSDNRFDIHELVRQYAEQQLKTSRFYPATQDAYATYFLKYLQQSEPQMATADQLQSMFNLEADFENIRSAWLWAVQSNKYSLIDYALDGLFRWFWLRRSRQEEGLALLDIAQRQWAPSAGQIPRPVWGRILARTLEQSGPGLATEAETRRRAEQALDIAYQQSDQAEITFCRWALGLVLVSDLNSSPYEKDYQPTIHLYQECIGAYRANGDSFRLAQTLEHLGHCFRRIKRFDLALNVLQESLDLRRALGDRFGMARSFRELGFVMFDQGLEHETEALWQAAYALQSELGDKYGTADSHFSLAILALSRGDWQRAKTIGEHVMQLATEAASKVLQGWASRTLVIATCMEGSSFARNHTANMFPSKPTPFTAILMQVLFLYKSWVDRRNQLLKTLMLAETDFEIAICVTFAAELVAQTGDLTKAAKLLALGFRYPEIAEGWIGQLSEIVALQHELKKKLPLAALQEAWEQGRMLDLQALAAELPDLLANSGAVFASMDDRLPEKYLQRSPGEFVSSTVH